VEEIEEAMFDSSQPTQRKRTLTYTNVEDVCLVRAWESVSLHVVSGNDQTWKTNWQRVERKKYHLMPPLASTPSHTYRSLQCYWDVITVDCNRWSGLLK
jgi:hypothetical protein